MSNQAVGSASRDLARVWIPTAALPCGCTYGALDLAIANVRDVLVRNSKQSQPYRGAMQMQLAAYEAEKRALAEAFPELVLEGAP